MKRLLTLSIFRFGLLFVGWGFLAVFPARGAITLEDCVLEALASNPALRAAAHGIEAGGAALGVARSARFPHLGLSAGYSRTDNPPHAFMMALNQRRLDMADPEFDPNRADDIGNLNLSAGVNYLLHDGGVRDRLTSMSEIALEQTEWRYRAVRNALVYEVVRAWYGVFQAHAVMDVREATELSIETLLKAARERLDAGTVVRTDVLNLEVRLAEAREERIRARNGLSLASAELNAAIGREFVSIADLPTSPEIKRPPPTAEPDADAYRQRPEWREAELAERMALKSLERARRGRRPRVLAFGSVNLDGESFDGFENSYVAGVSAELKVFEGFLHSSAIRRAAAEWRAAQSELAALRNRLQLELRRAALDVSVAFERIDVTERGVVGAEESLRITRERYAEGAVDVTELLMAQVAETAARTRAVAALFDYCVAIADMQRAGGVLVGRFEDGVRSQRE